jgi:Domain of unknown function (DUF5666)
MLKSNLTKSIAVLTALAFMVPGLALAQGINTQNKASATNDLGVTILGSRPNKDDSLKGQAQVLQSLKGRDDQGKHLGWFKNHIKDLKKMLYSGTVTAVSNAGFTFTAKDGSSLTVNTADAQILHVPKISSNTTIGVGDKVQVLGDKTDSSVKATIVYDFSANLKRAYASGEVTAVSANSITVKSDADSNITVDTNGDTKVVNADGSAGTLADVNTSDHVKVSGFWDTVLNVFHAVKIHLF